MVEPLVSICIPTHQGRPWIRETIAAALAQDYPRIEVVVADDVSTDGTVAAAESTGDPRVRVIRSGERLGMAGNWNRSVRLSRGDYVKFLMQDDWFDPSCVSRMADVLSRNPSVGFVFAPRVIRIQDPSDAVSVRLARRLEHQQAHLPQLDEVNDGRAIVEMIRKTGLRKNWIGEPTAVMARRESLRRVGLFNNRLRQLTDLELWLRLAAFFDVGYVPEPLSSFALHSTSATTANLLGGAAWLDAAWVLEGMRAHPELRARLGGSTEARMWAGVLIAEAGRYVRAGRRAGHSYRQPLSDYVRYRRNPTGDLHEPLDDTGGTS